MNRHVEMIIIRHETTLNRHWNVVREILFVVAVGYRANLMGHSIRVARGGLCVPRT